MASLKNKYNHFYDDGRKLELKTFPSVRYLMLPKVIWCCLNMGLISIFFLELLFCFSINWENSTCLPVTVTSLKLIFTNKSIFMCMLNLYIICTQPSLLWRKESWSNIKKLTSDVKLAYDGLSSQAYFWASSLLKGLEVVSNPRRIYNTVEGNNNIKNVKLK